MMTEPRPRLLDIRRALGSRVTTDTLRDVAEACGMRKAAQTLAAEFAQWQSGEAVALEVLAALGILADERESHDDDDDIPDAI